MEKYAWAIGLVLGFFGALPGIQSTANGLSSNTMTIHSWLLITSGLIILSLVANDVVAARNKRKEEMNQVWQSIKALEKSLVAESNERHQVDEKGLTVVLQQLSHRIGVVEGFVDVLLKK